MRTSPSFERVCLWLAVAGCVWFAFTAFWGIDVVPSGGHLGAGAACNAMVAEASIRWHTVYPLYAWYVTTDPYPGAAYCHHPMGAYWAVRVLLQIFGHRDFIINLPSATLSALTPPLLYQTAKRTWGPVAGVGAVFGFVFLPITVGYSIFNNLEVMTMFGGALFFWGHTRYQISGRRADLALSLLGAVFTTFGDWVGYLIMAPLLSFAFLRAFVLPEWMTPAVNKARYHRWWAMSVAVAVITFALWIGLFKHADKLTDWLSSADARSGAGTTPLAKVLEGRASWIDFSFTPLAIWVGKLAAPIALVRLLVRRRDEEIYSLAMLFGATVQYVVFKSGADVHIFWPQYFGAYYAFALAQLVVSAQDVASFVAGRLGSLHTRTISQSAAMVVLLVPSALVAPDTIRSLKIWRETGGRYNDKGTLFRSHVDMLVVEEAFVRGRLRPGETVGVHPGANWGWEHQWAIAGIGDNADEPSGAHPFWFARASGVGADHMKTLASKFPLRIYGDTIFVDRNDPYALVTAYSLHEHEPNIFQWMFTNNTEPVRTVTSDVDPFATWEWRHHLDQPVTPPTTEPKSLDEIRIAHNIAISVGDVDGAERLRERIVGQLTRNEVYFDGGYAILGVRVTTGVQPHLQVFVEASGPTKSDTTFQVRSTVIERLPFSLVPPDPIEREMAFPPPLSTKLWQKGFIYVFESTLNHRIGVERYWGHWQGGPAMKSSPAQRVDLVILR